MKNIIEFIKENPRSFTLLGLIIITVLQSVFASNELITSILTITVAYTGIKTQNFMGGAVEENVLNIDNANNEEKEDEEEA